MFIGKCFKYGALLTALVCATGVEVKATDYFRVVKAEQIKQMNTFERAQYQKALELLNKQQFKAAAVEFERFKTQFMSSEMLPYMLFLKGYALQRNNDRNAAIKVYNEVIDFFGGDIDVAAVAMYYRGLAALENGDYQKGMSSMKELVDDVDYQKEPIAGEALIALSDNYWRLNDSARAVQYLNQIIRDFSKTTPAAAENARFQLCAYYLFNGRGDELVNWYVEKVGDDKKSVEERCCEALKMACDSVFYRYWQYYNKPERFFSKGKAAKTGVELYKLMQKHRSSFEKNNDMWNFYYRYARLCSQYAKNPAKELDSLMVEAAKYIDSVKDEKLRQKYYSDLENMLRENNMFAAAHYINGKISDKIQAAKNEYYTLQREEKWEDALKYLATVRDNFKTQSEFVIWTKWEQAWVLKERQRKYDEAIKVYQEIAQPPRTLWEIQECYYRNNNLEKALSTLIEIENAFPDDGAEAAWRRAEYYDRGGNKDMAVKECRGIMKKYPSTPASSRSHQMLEKYGIETGGAVAD